MPHQSRYRLTADQIDQLSQRLVAAVSLIRERNHLAQFFNDLLTATEQVMLGKRLLIALFLEKGRSYAEISRVLSVGEQTIAAVSERLERDGRGFRLVLQKLEKEDKFEKLFAEVTKGFADFAKKLPRKAGPGRWRFLYPSK